MKKLFLLLSAAFLAFSCDEIEEIIPDDPNNEEDAVYATLTFEDADYADTAVASYWSLLIDSVEDGGDLLYAYDDDWYACSTYSWYDEGNTELASEIGQGANYYNPDVIEGALWNGGVAVSNYYKEVTAGTAVDYNNQLSIPYTDENGKSGYNGSDNFAIVTKGEIYFSDEVARVIDHAYVAATSYWLSVAYDGNDYSEPLGTGYFKLVATADTGKTAEFALATDGVILEGWNKWDLSSLGAVSSVTFSVDSDIQSYGSVSLPAYFAIDDIAVVIE